jgi:hypothetical protein
VVERTNAQSWAMSFLDTLAAAAPRSTT